MPPSAPEIAYGASTTVPRPVAAPQTHQGFLQSLYQKESGIKNPFLRTAAKVGTGIGRAAEGIVSPFVPELSFVPGTQLNAIAENRHDAAARAEQTKEDIDRENAGSERIKANAAANPPAKPISLSDAQGAEYEKLVGGGMSPEQALQEVQKQPASKETSPEQRTFDDYVKQGMTPAEAYRKVIADAQGAKSPTTDVIQRTGKDGKIHNVLVNKVTGEDIKDMGVGSKGDQMFGSSYAAVRLVDMAALYAPELMPFALNNLNKSTGGTMTPEQLQSIAENAKAGLATFNGQPLGVRSHLNPTTTTETQAQMADKLRTEIPRVQKEISSLAPQLGPVSGRAVTGFLAGTVGTTGDSKLDEALGTLRTDWPLLMSAASKMHIGTQKAIEDLEKTNNISGSSAKILTGFLDSVSQWAEQAQKEGRDINAPRTAATEKTPARPKGVPKSAVWNKDTHTWRLPK